MKKHGIRRHIITTGRAVKSVTSLNEGPWRWEVGVRAGLAMGLPVAIFTFLGNQSLGLMGAWPNYSRTCGCWYHSCVPGGGGSYDIATQKKRCSSCNNHFPFISPDPVRQHNASISLRVVTGVIIAAVVSQSLGAFRSYWVFIAVVAILQGSHDRRLSSIRAVQRVLGTVLGVLALN